MWWRLRWTARKATENADRHAAQFVTREPVAVSHCAAADLLHYLALHSDPATGGQNMPCSSKTITSQCWFTANATASTEKKKMYGSLLTPGLRLVSLLDRRRSGTAYLLAVRGCKGRTITADRTHCRVQ
jgi:hypothetical protein